MNEGESSPPFSLSRSFSQYLVGALFFSFYHLFLLRLGPLGSIFLSVDILFFFYISFSFLRFVRARARARSFAPRGLIRTRERMRCARPNNPFGKHKGGSAYATVCGRIFGIPARARNTS